MSTEIIILCVLLTPLVGGMLWAIWGMKAADITYWQRRQILGQITSMVELGADARECFSVMWNVSYADHYRRVMRFQNPYSLYPDWVIPESSK